MAHGLTVVQEPQLHQALHGYADGHRQLALSTTLKPRDQKRLLALSDISGPGARLDDDGYLTGYPLAESGFFALGRTWPAAEMPRPGCVWTHTLLIDFTDLAALESLTGLLHLFRRPLGSSAASAYSKQVILPARAQAQLSALAERWVRPVMAGLYGKPKRRIVVDRFGADVDSTVLLLWSQQWPRLRRSFRFCTFAASDRSTDNCIFDLQVLPSLDRSVRTRFAYVVDAENVAPSTGRWLDDAVEDLLHPDGSGLRDFFRRLGADVAAGREAFQPLCRLHRAVTDSHRQRAAVVDAIAILRDELGAKNARTAWATVARVALDRIETLDEQSFAFLWSNLSSLDANTLMSDAVRLGRSAWQRDPSMLVPFLNDEGALRVVVDRTLAELNAAELVAGLAQAPVLRRAALALRPELVGQPAFWTQLDSVDGAFRTARSWPSEATAAAVMMAGRGDLAPRTQQELGSRVILQALRASWYRVGDGIDTWLHASVVDSAAVAQFLATEATIPRPMLHGLTRTLPPDAVQNDYGEDPWIISDRHAVGAIDDAAASFMAAYLLSRALGQRSRCPGELAQLGFESTYTAVASNRLLDEGWRLLESRLPSSAIWFGWDRCQRLRVAVTDLFIDRGLPPGLFARLCENDKLFFLLSDEAAKCKRGRNYLKQVRRFMEDDLDIDFAPRLRVIKRILK